MNRESNMNRKSKMTRSTIAFAALLVALPEMAVFELHVRAEEGMWTFDNPPLGQLRDKYAFTPTSGWLDHLRLSSVRFDDGGSGSFVSPRGLVLTNHHVALGQLQKVSSPQKDYVADGFYAASAAEELRCPDLELNVLVSMENVTSRVQGASPATARAAQALEARKKAIAAIEQESTASTGLRSDVVPLYQSSEYWLYRYKKYTDVRLVFAPEQPIAFFGGDPDNFTFPRYDFDIALFRVYENNAPVASRDYLKWSAGGAADGELVFVSGHPGSTDRLDTVAQLETQRDIVYPISIDVVSRRIAVMRKYSERGAEQARQATNMLFGLENASKAYKGEYQGLNDSKLFAKKRDEERDFRARIDGNREWKAAYGNAWDQVAAAERLNRSLYKASRFQQLRGSSLAALAGTLIRYIEEKQKPDTERVDGYHDSQLAGLELQLFSPAPVYPELDEVLLSDALQQSLEELGASDPFITAVLKGRTPAAVARDAIGGTRLADPAARKALAAAGPSGLVTSTDPLVVLARAADGFARKNQKTLDDQVTSVETEAGEKIGRARFAVFGHSAYPDATFTLRLSYGQVKGYAMNGSIAPPKTTLYGLYDRANGFDMKPPFELPRRYLDRRTSLDLATPMNFVTTNDIIGGNSGSPVVNRNGELVGVVFDGNIESLVGRFVYSEESNRSVAVHSSVIIEALRTLYDAGPLADELQGK
jgi:Peptidase S46